MLSFYSCDIQAIFFFACILQSYEKWEAVHLQFEARDCRPHSAGVCRRSFLIEVMLPGSIPIQGCSISRRRFLSHAEVPTDRHLVVNTVLSDLPIPVAEVVETSSVQSPCRSVLDSRTGVVVQGLQQSVPEYM